MYSLCGKAGDSQNRLCLPMPGKDEPFHIITPMASFY